MSHTKTNIKPAIIKNVTCEIRIYDHAPIWKWFIEWLLLTLLIIPVTCFANAYQIPAIITMVLIIIITIPVTMKIIKDAKNSTHVCDIFIKTDYIEVINSDFKIIMEQGKTHVSYLWQHYTATIHSKKSIYLHNGTTDHKNIYVSFRNAHSIMQQFNNRGYGVLIPGQKTIHYKRAKR